MIYLRCEFKLHVFGWHRRAPKVLKVVLDMLLGRMFKNCGVCTPHRLGCACHEKGSSPNTITLEIPFVSLLMNTHHVASQMNSL